MRVARFALATAAAVALTGTAMAQQKNLRIGMSEDSDVLDPVLSRTGAATSILVSICDTLLTMDKDRKILPGLATSWSWSPDALTLTLNLRQNVMFHDGTKFDADAVKVNLERAMTLPESQRKTDVAQIKAVVAKDASTAVIELNTPSVPLLAALTDRIGFMLSPKAIKENGLNVGRNPVCTGPYKFVERVAQDRVVIERFPGYWDKDAYFLDRITYRVIVDASVRLANLQAGDIDMLERLEPADLKRVQSDPKLKAVRVDTGGYSSLVVNTSKTEPLGKGPLGQDARVREALDLSIDRAAINDVVFEGQFIVGNQFGPPGSAIYNPKFPVVGRDVEKAKKILKDAGYTAPIPMEIALGNQPTTVRAAEMIQAMASEAGFDVKLKVMEFTAEINAAARGEFQVRGPIGLRGSKDADQLTITALHSKGVTNQGRYSNPEMDKLLESAKSETDPAKRALIYQEAAAINARDRAVIYIFHPVQNFVYSTRVTGFNPTADGFFQLKGVKLN